MAKTIAIKVDLQGTEAQQKKLAKLESEVKKLTTRRTELNKALKNGTISLNQYGKEIAKINTKLKANRREMLVARESILGLDSFTKKLGKSFARLGTAISGAFVGMFGVQKLFQIIGDGIKTIEGFEQQMAKVKAVTGATTLEMELLTSSAKNLGRASQFTASEVGKLQEEFAKLGFTTSEILAATDATLQLATATGIDLAEAAEVAASTLNAFGLQATDSQKVIDLMAESFSSSPLDIEKFRESMKLVAPTAKSVGESVQDTTAKLALLAKNGISGSIAGTQLNRVFIELNKKGLTLNEAMDKVANSSNKLGTATELVGDRGAKALQIFADQSQELGNLTQAFKDSAGEAQKMADIVGDTAEGAAKKLDSAWEGLLLTMGEGSEDVLKEVRLSLSEILNTVVDANNRINNLRKLNRFGSLKLLLTGEATEEEQKLLDQLNEQEEFMKNNISNSKALNQERLKQLNIVKQLIQASKETNDEEELESINEQVKIRMEYQKVLGDAVDAAIKDKNVSNEVVEAKKGESEETKNLNKELKKLKLTKEQINKLSLEELEDDDFDELDDAVEFNEKDYKKASKDKFDFLLEDSKKLGELRDKEQEDEADRFAQEANDKLQQEALLAEQIKAQAIDLANQTANALIDVSKRRLEREKQMQLDNLNARLEQGLINEQQFEQQREKIERKAFEKQKRLDIAQALSNGALAITKTIAQLGGIGAITPLGAASLALVGASTATQVGVIASQKFEDGGILQGASHANGGIDLGNNQEAEGGEAIINKRSTAMFKPLLSAINEAGGGISFASPNVSSGYFAQGGITQNSSIDTSGLRDEIASAVISSIGAIQVQNVATDTTTEAIKISNIQSEASFG